MRSVLLILVAWACQAQVHVNACLSSDVGATGGTCYNSPVSLPAGAPFYLAEERYGNFSYHLPMADGTYNVTLHFIENSTAVTGVGQRQFSVSINGAAVLAAFDLAQAAPLNTPVDRSFPVIVAGGVGVTIVFTTVVRNAVVSAIDITGPPVPAWLSGASAIPPTCTGLSMYYSTTAPALWFCPTAAIGWEQLAWFGTVASAPLGAVLGLQIQATHCTNPAGCAGIRTVQAGDGSVYYLIDATGSQ